MNAPTWTGLESLEQRSLLTFVWSAQEVYLSELINRARANPAAEATRLGIDLAAGLSSAELPRLVTQEPLALSEFLTASARAHSLDMGVRNFFDHTNPSGLTPTQRAQAAGYIGTAGENIGAGFTAVDDVYRGWMASVVQRMNVLSLHSTFDGSYHYDELGIGIALEAGGTYNHYWTADFGDQPTDTTDYFLLGVVFADTDSSGFYGIGEGAAGATITVASGGSTIATYLTDEAGNYQIALSPGTYDVTVSMSGRLPLTRQATIGTMNVKLDTLVSQMTLIDDHADAGEWGDASELLTDPETGNALGNGQLSVAADSDLFVFTAVHSGVASIAGLSIAPSVDVRVRIYNAVGTLLATGTSGGVGGRDSYATTEIASGQDYFVLIEHDGSNTGVGSYVLTMQGPEPDPIPDPDDHADAGDWGLATPLFMDSETGNGAGLGEIESADDGDLFRFTGQIAGLSRITVHAGSGDLTARFTVYNVNGIPVGTGSVNPDAPTDTVFELNVVAGQTYYLLIGAAAETTGGYSIAIQGPEIDPDPDPDPEPVVISAIVAPNLGVSGAIDSNGRLVMSFLNDGSRPVFVTRNTDGTWSSIDLLTEAGGPSLNGAVLTWTSAADGTEYAAARSGVGLILFQRDGEGEWAFRNLTAELAGAQSITGPLTMLVDVQGRPQVFGLAADGDLLGYRQLGTRNTAGDWRWSSMDIADTHLAARHRAMPVLTGTLNTWVTTANSLNIVGLDSSGDIQLFFKQGTKRWNVVNLSNVTGAATLTGAVTAWQTPNRAVGIAGVDAAGHIWVASWMPGGRWTASDITEAWGGPRVRAGSLTSFTRGETGAYLAGVTTIGKVQQFRLVPTTGRWRTMSITNNVSAGGLNFAPRLRGSIVSVVAAANTAGHGSAGGVSILGTNADGHAIRYWWQPGARWRAVDVTDQLA